VASEDPAEAAASQVSVDHGGSATVWRWEGYSPDGIVRIEDVLPAAWWTLTADEAAELAMAQMMVRVRPDFQQLAGWRVRAWRDGDEGWSAADDWLAVAATARNA